MYLSWPKKKTHNHVTHTIEMFFDFFLKKINLIAIILPGISNDSLTRQYFKIKCQVDKKKYGSLHKFAWDPCAGAMLISVLFQY